MMPYCDIEGCEEVADKIYSTEEEFGRVALCTRHNPESPRKLRRTKFAHDPKFTKKYDNRRSKSREQVLKVEEVRQLHSRRRRMLI